MLTPERLAEMKAAAERQKALRVSIGCITIGSPDAPMMRLLADPSPANVLELAAEVERLREIVNQHVPLPSVARLFNEPELLLGYLDVHCGNLSSIHSIIQRCHIHGVEVPEHLKPYEVQA